MIYLLALLGVIGCMLLVDRRFELFLWHRPLPALLVLAAGVAYPFGIVLSPAVGALFMSLSTVIVALNATLLRRVRLD